MREHLAAGNILPHLRVQAFNGIGGVDQTPELNRIFEEGGEAVPVIAPAGDRHGIAGAPSLFEALQSQLGGFRGRRRIDRPHGGAENLAILPGNEFGGIAYLMNDTELHVGRRENAAHRIRQSGESIAAENQYVLYATRLQIIEDLEPKARAFGFFNPDRKSTR